MKFVRTKENGEKLYVEAIEHKDLAYYRDSPRWKPCSDEEWGKAMNPVDEVITGDVIPDADIEAKVLELVEQGYSREYAEKVLK